MSTVERDEVAGPTTVADVIRETIRDVGIEPNFEVAFLLGSTLEGQKTNRRLVGWVTDLLLGAMVGDRDAIEPTDTPLAERSGT